MMTSINPVMDFQPFIPPLDVPAHNTLPRRELRGLKAAAQRLRECRRVLEKGGLNVVGEILRTGDTFVEDEHYPPDDVYDAETRAQYYYHAHRGVEREHGHFHTFIRVNTGAGTDEPVHLIAISMDDYGWPQGLFAVNHWVTGGLWADAENTIKLLPAFCVDHAFPSWPVNLWLAALVALYRPQICALLRHRDRVIEARRAIDPGTDVLEDRRIEITGFLPIDLEQAIDDVLVMA